MAGNILYELLKFHAIYHRVLALLECIRLDLKKIKSYQALVDVLEVLPVAVVVAKVDSRKIVYVNSSFEKLSGFSLDYLFGKPQTILHPSLEPSDDGFSIHANLIEKKNKTAVISQKLLHKDGYFIDVDVTANQLKLSAKNMMLGFFSPVTDRVKALNDLVVKEQELDAIIQTSTVGIMLLKGDRVLHRANQRLADILGYESADEMTGMSMAEFHIDDEHYKEFGELYYQTLRLKENLQVEYQVKKKSGEHVWIVISGKAIDQSIPADLNKGVIWVLDDITEKKCLEFELEKETRI